MKTILVDADKCIECHNCDMACKNEHCTNDWSPIAAPQGKGQQWIRIESEEVSTGDRARTQHLPVLCQHCKNAACIAACPNGAIYRREDGIVIIDPTKCKGCGTCVAACGYAAIALDVEAGVAQKCTMCAHLLDEGWERPRCVTACPADALRFVDVEDLTVENLQAPLERLHPATDDDPLVKYVNLPKPFVGGTVVVAHTDEAVRGVKVTARHQVTGCVREACTDAFGDFDLAGLAPGFYTVAFDKDGFDYKEIKNVDLRSAVNMETVALRRYA